MTEAPTDGILFPYHFDSEEFGDSDFEETFFWALGVVAVVTVTAITYGVMRFRSKRRRP